MDDDDLAGVGAGACQLLVSFERQEIEKQVLKVKWREKDADGVSVGRGKEKKRISKIYTS